VLLWLPEKNLLRLSVTDQANTRVQFFNAENRRKISKRNEHGDWSLLLAESC